MTPAATIADLASHAMNLRVLTCALLAALFLGAVALSALSFYALVRAKALVDSAEQRVKAEQERCQALLESLRESHNLLAAEVREIHDQPQIALTPGSPRPGLNLTTRSQALRMHRRGDPPDRIASALDIPRQEVDLLLKVHRIVISNV
jgi:hypothetical protein